MRRRGIGVEFVFMKKHNSFFTKIPLAFWLVISVLILFICALPVLFVKFSIIDFTSTGQIGDTIGGIMGPFIAILAALLTFIAFWAQYDANKELIRENERNHFENRFYKMMDIHLDNTKSLATDNNSNTSVFKKWCSEIESYYKSFTIPGLINEFEDYVQKKLKDEVHMSGFLNYVDGLLNDDETRFKVIFDICYSLFYTASVVQYMPKDEQSEYINNFAVLYNAFMSEEKFIKLDNRSPKNEMLGRYYRHLYQIIYLIDDQPNDLYQKNSWREDYFNLLRSQMSDYEQLLLYYHSQSSFGEKWDKSNYIEKYYLIKNIPLESIHISAGIPPIQRYSKVIKELESRGKQFFDVVV